MTDALGNEIVIDKLYGYSNRANGVVTVIIGTAKKINKSSVTINIVKRGTSVYQDNIKEESFDRPITSCSSNSLFPLQTEEVSWDVNEAKDLLIG